MAEQTRTRPTVTATAPRIVLRDEDLVEALDQAADVQVRNRTHQAVHYIREGLRRDGFLPSAGDTLVPGEE